MSKNPWFKFCPSDWRGDPKLRMCSIAARGLWIEMMCIMHEAKPYGHLLIEGESVSDAELARAIGMDAGEVETLIAELEKWAVFSRNGKGVIYSRRMVRDEKKAQNARKNGKSGGNPKLSKQTQNSAPDNQKGNPPVKGQDKPQIPDTRSQKPDSPQTPHADEPAATGGDGGGGWLNSEGVPWLASTGLGDQRARSSVNLWLETHPPDVIEDAIRRAMVAPKDNPVAWIGRVLTNAAADGYRKARAGQKPLDDDPPEMRDREGAKWRAVLCNYRDKGFWSELLNGPKPGEPYCNAPTELVAEIIGDTEDVRRKLEEVA